MPFVDLNLNKVQPFEVQDFDVVIIGAGAAGILLSVKLSSAGQKVLLIESGHFNIDEEKQKLNEVEQSGKELKSAIWGRKRAIGGTTLAWGGQSLPFSKIDFEKREWMENSGWPLNYEDLEPYYKEANVFMKIDQLNYRGDIFNRTKIEKPLIDESLLDYHVSKWAKQPNFRLMYNEILEKKVTVLYNAQLTKIYIDENKNVEKISVSDFKKQTYEYNVSKLILATGTIESIRILLTNNIGDNSPNSWLGKCFMEHPCIEAGIVTQSNSYKLQKLFNTHLWKGNKYSIRLSLSEEVQNDENLLNCSAGIMFNTLSDSPYAALKKFLSSPDIKSFYIITKNLKSLFFGAKAFLIHKFYFKLKTENKLVLMAEQEPLRSSYIFLGDTKDEFGIQRAKIHWDITHRTWNTVIKTAELCKVEIERLKLGEVYLHKKMQILNSSWKQELSDVNHHMGGCKMSAISSEGVVDKNLQVWGISNLFICSCAVFPTSSHSNPTLTLLALASRLSKTILSEIGQKNLKKNL